MSQIESMLNDLLDEYDFILSKTEKLLSNAPEGGLRASTSNGCAQFYCVKEPNEKEGVYIRKSKKDLITKLAMKEYILNVEKYVRPQKKLIDVFLKKFDENALEKAFISMQKQKWNYCNPYWFPDDLFIEQWKNKMRLTIENDENWKNRRFDNCSFSTASDGIEGLGEGVVTEQGEKVRSKSEKIIADKLDKLGIPYVYEAPLVLKNGKVFHPDFTILNINTRKNVYWEHFGMMSDLEYAHRMTEKVEMYEINDLIPGRDLIFTYEFDKMNTEIVCKLIAEYGLTKHEESLATEKKSKKREISVGKV